jgi:hypothetical protein
VANLVGKSPEIVAHEVVLDTALEFPDVGAVVEAGLGTDAVALAAGPLTGIAVIAIQSVDVVTLAVMAMVAAPTCLALDVVAVIFVIGLIALILSLAEEVVDARAAVSLQRPLWNSPL